MQPDQTNTTHPLFFHNRFLLISCDIYELPPFGRSNHYHIIFCHIFSPWSFIEMISKTGKRLTALSSQIRTSNEAAGQEL